MELQTEGEKKFNVQEINEIRNRKALGVIQLQYKSNK